VRVEGEKRKSGNRIEIGPRSPKDLLERDRETFRAEQQVQESEKHIWSEQKGSKPRNARTLSEVCRQPTPHSTPQQLQLVSSYGKMGEAPVASNFSAALSVWKGTSLVSFIIQFGNMLQLLSHFSL